MSLRLERFYKDNEINQAYEFLRSELDLVLQNHGSTSRKDQTQILL